MRRILTIAAAGLLSYVLTKLQVLPGTTAVWGSSPGAAAAMTIMSESYGADARLVAFMQYLRVVFVAVAASVVSTLWTSAEGAEPPPLIFFPPVDWPAFAATIALTGLCAYGAARLRIQGGTIISGRLFTSGVVGVYWISCIRLVWKTTLPGVTAMFLPSWKAS